MRRLLILSLGVLVAACTADEAGVEAAGTVAATAAEHAGDAPAATPITEVPPAVAVREENVAYGASTERNLEGYFAVPADVIEPLPGIVMIHERWGLNDNIRAMARRLAGEGYAVLAVDLYGGQTAATPSEAEALMSEVMRNRAAVLDNLRQAHSYLDQAVLAPRTAVLGWCLGGGWALEGALSLADAVDAVVMFYGQIITDENRLATLEAPLLGHFAELDASVPLASARQFRSVLRDLGKDADVRIYAGTDHAFANPSGTAYDHEAALEAWGLTVEFLDRAL